MGSFTPNGMPAPSPLRRSSTFERGSVRGERGVEVAKIWARRHPCPPQAKGARPRARPASNARAHGAATPEAPCGGRPAILGRQPSSPAPGYGLRTSAKAGDDTSAAADAVRPAAKPLGSAARVTTRRAGSKVWVRHEKQHRTRRARAQRSAVPQRTRTSRRRRSLRSGCGRGGPLRLGSAQGHAQLTSAHAADGGDGQERRNSHSRDRREVCRKHSIYMRYRRAGRAPDPGQSRSQRLSSSSSSQC